MWKLKCTFTTECYYYRICFFSQFKIKVKQIDKIKIKLRLWCRFDSIHLQNAQCVLKTKTKLSNGEVFQCVHFKCNYTILCIERVFILVRIDKPKIIRIIIVHANSKHIFLCCVQNLYWIIIYSTLVQYLTLIFFLLAEKSIASLTLWFFVILLLVYKFGII